MWHALVQAYCHVAAPQPCGCQLQGSEHLYLCVVRTHSQMLKALGLSDFEIEQIEGLGSVSIRGGYGLTEEQLSSRAVARLAANPTAEVGRMQQLTALWLLRPCKSWRSI